MLSLTDPDVVLFNATTIQREVDTAAYLSQINMMVYGGIGMFGLLLAAVGISGITAYSVVQRRKEIGIRLALGASRGHIMRLVTKEGAVLVTLGMVIGLGIAYAGARAMGAYFSGLAQAMGTTTRDPVLLLGAPLLLGLLTMIAAYFPARRSLGINPAATLKDE
jgi:ABC-type antimicrobial peptide transport system permease subunit